ncbi:MAG: hypothetical protein Q8T13_00220 [Acidobacteriota bacterium]|nr:hypothetical protein [Acidobacteriota bacterium]
MPGITSFAVLSAAIFFLTPLLWHLAASNPVALLPLLPVTAWLLMASLWAEARTWKWAMASGAALGLGLYTSLGAVVMMPAYFVITLAILIHARAASSRQVALCLVAFFACASPMAVTWLRDPEPLRIAINSHHLYDADRYNVLQGAREITSWVGLTARSEVYWDYFNPAFLFLTGVVLFPPVMVLLPVGLFALLREPTTPLTRLWLAGLAVAPLAAALTAEAPIPARALYITPFAAIIAAVGAQCLSTLVRRRT